MKNSSMRGLSNQEREFISIFSANEEVTVDANDIIEIRSISKEAANQILSRLAKKGWLQRVKHGTYTIVPLSSLSANPMIEEVWPLVVKLYKPAFLSGWTAAEHWDLTEQVFNSVSLVTQNQQRKSIQNISGIRVKIRVIKEERFFGMTNIWFGRNQVEIADPSRLIIDILDMPEFGGGGRHTTDIVKAYWNSDMHNADLILEYAIRYGKGSVLKRLGFLAEAFSAPVSKKWIRECNRHIKTGISDLDPGSPSKGRISGKWNLRINLPV
ncbi:MAG: type IV toxin-antitoxin system AbiEi family antitoxin domain-containing protein [Bacteroidales bacterium]|nr:type IV toxin-antitoxin system AbiEi family antitoxin domain-containing protein [Bacteroidales bacterium]